MNRRIVILAVVGLCTVVWMHAPWAADPAEAKMTVRTLSTGRVAIRVPEGRIRCVPPRTGQDVPGPILGIRGPDGVWRGAGWIEGPTPVIEIDGAKEASEHVVTYAFAGGGRAEVRFWVPTGTDHVRVTEECHGCTSSWVLSFAKNFAADRVLAKPTPEDDGTGIRRTRREGHVRHGRVAVWSHFGRLLDLNDYMGVFGGRAPRDFVGVIRIHPEAWRRPARNFLSLCERDGQLQLEGTWQSGRREWLLVVTTRTGDQAADAREHLRAIERHWVWNRQGWVLDWDEPLPQYRPAASATEQRDKAVVLSALDELTSHLATHGYLAPPDTRRFLPVCLTYDRLRRLGVLAPDEDRRARRALAALAYNCYRKELFPWDKLALPRSHPECLEPLVRGLASPTFDAERCALVGIVGSIFPRHPMSRIWVEHFTAQFRRLTESSLYPGGYWEEGFAGAYETLLSWTPTAMRLRQSDAPNLFTDPCLHAMWDLFVLTATPRNRDQGGRRSIPAVGECPPDEAMRDLLLLGAAAYAGEDPRFAGRLSWLHREMGGSDRDNPGRPLNALWPGGWPEDGRGFDLAPWTSQTSAPQELTSVNLPGFGAVLRGMDAAGDETCLILRNGLAWGRSHRDEGSILLYAKGTALIAEAGNSGKGPWQLAARGHSRVAFPGFEPANSLDGSQYGYARSHRGQLRSFVALPGADYLCGSVPTVGREARDPHAPYSLQPSVEYFDDPIDQQRHILFLKPDYFVLYDQMKCDVPHDFWLHVRDAWVTTDTGKATFACPNGVTLDAFFLEPKVAPLRTGQVLTSQGLTRHVAVAGRPTDSYRTVLYPRRRSEQRPSVRRAAAGVVEVRHRDGWDLVVLDTSLHRYRDWVRQVVLEASVAAVRRRGRTWTAVLIAGRSISLPGLTIRPAVAVSVQRDPRGRIVAHTPDHAEPVSVHLEGRWLWRRQLRIEGEPETPIKNRTVDVRLPPGANRFQIE